MIGTKLVALIWGGQEITQFTINRLFAVHFFLPLATVVLLASHILALHTTGSSNPTGMTANNSKSFFLSFSVTKDLYALALLISLLLTLVLLKPIMLGDHDNFNVANKLDTPQHIQPEWYFLFAYAILRSIPNKLGGVLALATSVAVIVAMPAITGNSTPNKVKLHKTIF